MTEIDMNKMYAISLGLFIYNMIEIVFVTWIIVFRQ